MTGTPLRKCGCGGSAMWNPAETTKPGGPVTYNNELGYVGCTSCGLRTEGKQAQEIAASEWNRALVGAHTITLGRGEVIVGSLLDIGGLPALLFGVPIVPGVIGERPTQEAVQAALSNAAVVIRFANVEAMTGLLDKTKELADQIVIAGGATLSRPDPLVLLANAMTALKALDDWTNINETEFTGWGDQIVPPAAEWWRVKTGQALKALQEVKIP